MEVSQTFVQRPAKGKKKKGLPGSKKRKRMLGEKEGKGMVVHGWALLGSNWDEGADFQLGKKRGIYSGSAKRERKMAYIILGEFV